VRLQTLLFLYLGPLLIARAYQGTIVEKAGRPLPFAYSLGIDASFKFALRDNLGPRSLATRLQRCSIRIELATISMTKAQCRRAVAAVRRMERKCSTRPRTKPFQFLFPVFSRFRWTRAQGDVSACIME